MNQEHEKEAINLLSKLRRTFKADLLTCYFQNPHSGYYWLFYKDGKFAYPYQMNGPLTSLDQHKRMNTKKSSESKLGVAYFKKIPIDLSENVLSATSFIKREKIQHVIRIRFSDYSLLNRRSSKDLCSVIIFLNYLNSDFFPLTKVQAELKVKPLYHSLKDKLIYLSSQPKLNNADAWRLRSVMLKFQSKLGEVLGINAQKTCEELYKFIVEQALKLITPKYGKNILCDLSAVNANNRVTSLHVNKKNIIKEPNKGIVAYVGQTGQIFLINDVQKYNQKINNNPLDSSLPRYIVCNKNTCCEIAIPLIIQNRVIGVLNLEADAKNAYDEANILILFQFAAAAAQALHQATLWKNINTAIKQNHWLSQLNEEQEIFKSTIDAANELEYNATIWDFQKQRWYNQLTGTKDPRRDGFSEQVRKKGRPIALTDIRIENDMVKYDGKIGVIGDSGLFIKWEKFDDSLKKILPSESLDKIARNIDKNSTLTNVITDLGFPIFELTDDGNLGPVRATLWIKCHRHFLSLVNDDIWCLSLLCRNTSDSLKAFNKTTRDILTYHFGTEKSETIIKLNENALVAKEADNLIVMNIDIRDSTELCKFYLRNNRVRTYVKLISKYHEKIREVILKYGGVMDKTMGDGIQALFNVYQPTILSIGKDYKLEVEKKNAISCAFECFKVFDDLLIKFKGKLLWNPIDRGEICLGAGLTLGSGFIGSFSKFKGLEYSILGDVPNRAAKIGSSARTVNVKNYLLNSIDFNSLVKNCEVTINLKKLTDKQIKKIVKTLEKPLSVLCVDKNFFTEAHDQDYCCFCITMKGSSDYELFLFLREQIFP